MGEVTVGLLAGISLIAMGVGGMLAATWIRFGEAKGWWHIQLAQSDQPFAFYHKPSGRVWNWKTMKPMEQEGLKWVDVSTEPDWVGKDIEGVVKSWQPLEVPSLGVLTSECLYRKLLKYGGAQTKDQIDYLESMCHREARDKITEVRKHNASLASVEYWPHDGVAQGEDNGESEGTNDSVGPGFRGTASERFKRRHYVLLQPPAGNTKPATLDRGIQPEMGSSKGG